MSIRTDFNLYTAIAVSLILLIILIITFIAKYCSLCVSFNILMLHKYETHMSCLSYLRYPHTKR